MTDPGALDRDSLDVLAGVLGSSPPFDALAPDRLKEVAKATHEERFATGTTILHQGGQASIALFVIRSGHVQIVDRNRTIDQPGPGEVFGELSLLSGTQPTATVVAEEGLVCLVVDGEVARQVLGTAGGVAFVQSSLRRGLLRSLDRETRSLADTIEEAADASEAITAARELPQLACALVDDGADAVKIGHVIGSSIDALTRRLLAHAIQDLGDPPASWAWMALGSEARLEQALHTDQDHALAYDLQEGGPETAGIPRCNGDAMAITPVLRRSVQSWADALRAWMSDIGRDGSIFTSVVFDHRQVAGPLDVEPAFQAAISSAPERYPDFIRHLAHRALERKPPTGFIRDFVVEAKGEHAGRLDVKHGGVTIISNLARYFAIRGRRPEKGTLARLEAAEDLGDIDADSREALVEAFRLLWQIRLEHQVRQVRAGTSPDDFVDPAHLGPIQRLGLKEAFRIITKEQQGLAAEIGARY
jgi:signal-transduction protein with cAMP-binding, CBS, and nucleotidyltransferase domain